MRPESENADPQGSELPDVLLLVEDDPDHAFLVRRRLREQLQPEFDVVHLATAAEATTQLARGHVRCVVLDLSLPALPQRDLGLDGTCRR